jgi:hypothetical protein
MRGPSDIGPGNVYIYTRIMPMRGGECRQMEQHSCNWNRGCEHPAHTLRYAEISSVGASTVTLVHDALSKVPACSKSQQRKLERRYGMRRVRFASARASNGSSSNRPGSKDQEQTMRTASRQRGFLQGGGCNGVYKSRLPRPQTSGIPDDNFLETCEVRARGFFGNPWSGEGEANRVSV